MYFYHLVFKFHLFKNIILILTHSILLIKVKFIINYYIKMIYLILYSYYSIIKIINFKFYHFKTLLCTLLLINLNFFKFYHFLYIYMYFNLLFYINIKLKELFHVYIR